MTRKLRSGIAGGGIIEEDENGNLYYRPRGAEPAIRVTIVEGEADAALLRQQWEFHIRTRLHSALQKPIQLDAEISGVSEPKPSPPPWAEWFVSAVVDRKRADALLGDLQERFEINLELRGEREARRLYWHQVLHSIAPLLWTAVKKMLPSAIVLIVRRWR